MQIKTNDCAKQHLSLSSVWGLQNSDVCMSLKKKKKKKYSKIMKAFLCNLYVDMAV